MTTGEKIKKLRLSAGMSQSDLASALHTSKQTIYKYENGIVSNIPIDKVEKLSEFLGCSPSYLTGWDADGVDVRERLKNRRKELGLTAQDVADALGVSRATVYRYENSSIRKLPASILSPLADVLKCPVSYLISQTNVVDGCSADDVNAVSIGSAIQRRRVEKGMTLEQLGVLVGVGKSTVRKWETGAIKSIGYDKVVRLAHALGVPPSQLVELESLPAENPAAELMSDPALNHLASGYCQLNEEGRRLIADYVAMIVGSGRYTESAEEE